MRISKNVNVSNLRNSNIFGLQNRLRNPVSRIFIRNNFDAPFPQRQTTLNGPALESKIMDTMRARVVRLMNDTDVTQTKLAATLNTKEFSQFGISRIISGTTRKDERRRLGILLDSIRKIGKPKVPLQYATPEELDKLRETLRIAVTVHGFFIHEIYEAVSSLSDVSIWAIYSICHPNRRVNKIRNFARFENNRDEYYDQLIKNGFIDRNGYILQKFDGQFDNFKLSDIIDERIRAQLFSILQRAHVGFAPLSQSDYGKIMMAIEQVIKNPDSSASQRRLDKGNLHQARAALRFALNEASKYFTYTELAAESGYTVGLIQMIADDKDRGSVYSIPIIHEAIASLKRKYPLRRPFHVENDYLRVFIKEVIELDNSVAGISRKAKVAENVIQRILDNKSNRPWRTSIDKLDQALAILKEEAIQKIIIKNEELKEGALGDDMVIASKSMKNLRDFLKPGVNPAVQTEALTSIWEINLEKPQLIDAEIISDITHILNGDTQHLSVIRRALWSLSQIDSDRLPPSLPATLDKFKSNATLYPAVSDMLNPLMRRISLIRTPGL